MIDEQQQPVSSFGVSSPEPVSARQLVNERVDAGLLDELRDRVDRDGLALTGAGGLKHPRFDAALMRVAALG
jgi:putative transposase